MCVWVDDGTEDGHDVVAEYIFGNGTKFDVGLWIFDGLGDESQL